MAEGRGERVYPLLCFTRKFLNVDTDIATIGKVTLADVRAAIAAFERLPMKQQRDILNGWRPLGLVQRHDYNSLQESSVLVPVLELECCGPHPTGRYRSCVHGDHSAYATQSNADVFVLVREGLPREATVSHLLRAIQTLNEYWGTLTDLPGGDEGFTQEW